MTTKKIVIVGGGASGLELIARLSKQYKNNPSIHLTLIDNQLKHIWKPLFHQVAAGSFNDTNSIADYLVYAQKKKFEFVLGSIKSLDRKNKVITLNEYHDAEKNILLPERKIHYDILVFSIGSQVNDFNIPGVKEHCLMIDTINQAEFFNKKLLKEIIKQSQVPTTHQLNITIVGGGATGVELASEINFVLNKIFGANEKHSFYQITILEAGDRILSALPPKISTVITQLLKDKGIEVHTNTQVSKVTSSSVETITNKIYPSSITIWVAGVKANEVLKNLEGLEFNKLNQLVVNQYLQTTQDENIFAMGDCAACLQTKNDNSYPVPARAQAATQQAKLMAKNIEHLLKHTPLQPFIYKDYGSLVSLSNGTVGNLMSRIAKSMYIEGWLARFFYWSLYKRHLLVVHGWKYVILQTMNEFIHFINKPEIKLH